MAPPTHELFFESHNEDRPETIVLLHGLVSSLREWDLVVPHLRDYHVLAVDLNGHSRSRDAAPTTAESAADNVAALIHGRARGGRAHVVGLSFGGFVGLALARQHPGAVRSVFASGASPFLGLFRWMAERPSTIWYSLRALMGMPEWLYWRMVDWMGMRRYEALYAEMQANLRWESVRDAYTSILRISFEDVARIEARVLSVSAGRDDDLRSAARMGRVLREGRAVVVRGAVHAWDLQFPELFARGILAWVRGEELPGEFEPLASG